MPAPNTSTDTMPLVEASKGRSTAREAIPSSEVVARSARPTTASGTIHKMGLR